MSFLVAEPSASPTEAFPPKRTKNLGSLFRLSWGSRLTGSGWLEQVVPSGNHSHT